MTAAKTSPRPGQPGYREAMVAQGFATPESAVTADLCAIAATTLRRLASEMRAAAHAGARGTVDGEVAAALLAETRREAIADLGRLRDSLPVGNDGGPRPCAVAQVGLLSGPEWMQPSADEIDRWAAAWEASP